MRTSSFARSSSFASSFNDSFPTRAESPDDIELTSANPMLGTSCTLPTAPALPTVDETETNLLFSLGSLGSVRNKLGLWSRRARAPSGGRLESHPVSIVLAGDAGSQAQLMGTYRLLVGRKMNAYPIYTMTTDNIAEVGQLATPGR